MKRGETKTSMGDVTGPVLSGQFTGPVTLEVAAPPPVIQPLHTLRQPPRNFVGRGEDLEVLLAAGEDVAAITGLRGLGGIGKTALALVAAERLKDRFPDAQLDIELRGSRADPLSPAEAMLKVIRAWHPDARLPEDTGAIAEHYRSVLHGKRALLLFDDARDEAQVEPLLPPASCYVLITSRRRLVLDGLRTHDLGTLSEADARSLLVKIAPRLGEAAGELAGLCGCLPLALRVAASQVASHPLLEVQEYVARLREARGRLPEVEASLSLSYELLPGNMKRRWGALAVFPADFDASAAAAVFACEEAQARAALDELVGGSLVQWEEKAGRLRLHDLVRTYADSLIEPGLRGGIQARHAEHYLGVLSAADDLYLKGGDGVNRGLALADREWPNILAGQRWAAGSDDKTARRLCSSYPDAGVYVLDLRLHPAERIQWLESAVEVARMVGDRGAEGVHLGNLGNAYADLGEPHKAIEYHEQALVIDREMGDRRREGVILGNLGIAWKNLGEPHKAIEYYEQALVIAHEIGDRRGEGNALGNLGNAYAALGEPQKAIEYYEKSLAISREIGDRRGEGNALGNLGLAYADLGEPHKAIEYYEQALVISCEIGDRRAEGNDLGNLGLAYAALGEPHKAIEYYEKNLAISREIGDRRGEGNALGNLGMAYAALGGPHKAIEYYEKHLAIAREIGDRRGEANACWNIGDELAKSGDLRRAVELMQVCVDFEREIGHPDAQKRAAQVARLQAQLSKRK